jgi:hypothetical protein
MDANGVPYSGAVLKAYQDGTSTPINLATDYTGGTLVSTITLNAAGYPAVSGNVCIPHAAENLKLALYPTSAAASSNTGAIWTVDNIQITSGANSAGVLTNVASASTVNLNDSTTNYFNITGTTAITAITLAEGSQVVVKFADALTLTDGASLVCLGGENITTAAGDIAEFRGESSGVVRMLRYHKANGTALSGAATSGQALIANGAGGSSWSNPKTYDNTGYVTNRYYFGLSASPGSGASHLANQLYGRVFTVGKQATFTRIGIEVTTGHASNARLGIYNFDGGIPTSLVLDAGTVSAASTGAKEITISQALSPGLYVVAAVFESASSETRTVAATAGTHAHFLGFGSFNAATDGSAFYGAHTYGALPSTFPASLTYDSSDAAGVWLRVV